MRLTIAAINNLIIVLLVGRIKQLLILCCYYFKLFGSMVPKDIEVDPVVSFHLTALLSGHLFFLLLHLKILNSLEVIYKSVKHDFLYIEKYY